MTGRIEAGRTYVVRGVQGSLDGVGLSYFDTLTPYGTSSTVARPLTGAGLGSGTFEALGPGVALRFDGVVVSDGLGRQVSLSGRLVLGTLATE